MTEPARTGPLSIAAQDSSSPGCRGDAKRLEAARPAVPGNRGHPAARAGGLSVTMP